MKFEAKHFLLALFLCIGFTLVLGYGLYLFGDCVMISIEKIEKFSATLLLVGFGICIVGLLISLIADLWTPRESCSDEKTTIECAVKNKTTMKSQTLKLKSIHVEYEERVDKKNLTE